MKLAVVIGLVGLALASTQWDSRPEKITQRSFQTGQQYVYHFDGQVASGLATPSSQQSATRINSIVSLVFESERAGLLKLQKTRVGSNHGDLVEPRDVQPYGVFEETKLTPEQSEKLALPVRFRYEQGLVSDVEFDGDDQPWSENIKRAVLNMLSINLGKKSRTDVAELTNISEEEKFESNDYFTTSELTLEGECETAYTIVPAGDDKIRVSKSINFEKCIKRVDVRYNMRFGEECPSCEKKMTGEERNTESATVFKFELNGDAEKFLIREVELRSQYLFAPLSKEQNHMASYVANKLTLIHIEENKGKTAIPQNVEKKESIVYSTEWEENLEKFRMTGEESLIRDAPYSWMNKKMDIVRNIFNQIAQTMLNSEEKETESHKPEINHQIARLVEVLRVATKEEIKKMESEAEKKNEQVRAIFHDALAIAGTKNTIEHINNKIVSRDISPLKAARLLKELMTSRTSSEKIIDSLVRVCEDEVSRRNPLIKQSCWLTVGSLMNNLCGNSRSQLALEISSEKKNSRNVCPRVLKEKYVELLNELFRKADNTYEKTLALKTIANSGMDLIVFPLEKIIMNKSEERTIRLQAIDSLRKLRSVMPRKMQSVLMPLYKNAFEQPEIRVAAFHQMMQTIPERAIIDQITEQLTRERSTQVHSFVYATLSALAKSDIPCEKEMAGDIEQSLRLARVQPRKVLDSQYLRASLYDNEYFTGAALNWAMLFSNDSVLPKEVMASIDSVFGGEWNKYLAQIGFSQHNLDQLLYKILEKVDESESLDEVVVRGKRATTFKPVEYLRQLMKNQKIQKRERSVESANAMVYLRYKDMDYAVLPIDNSIIESLTKKIVKDGKIEISEIERLLSKGLRFSTDVTSFVYETTRVIPTTLGLPLEITGKLPTTFAVEGELKVELLPQSGKSMNGVRVNIRAEPKIASTHVTHMEIRSPIISNGVKIMHSIYAAIPVDMDIEMNWNKGLKIENVLRTLESRKEQQVLSLSTRPVTYIRHENEPSKMESAIEKTVTIDGQTVELEHVYGEKVLGMRVAVRGNVHRHLLEKLQQGKTLPVFIGENFVEIVLERTSETPREYKFVMTIDAFDEEKEQNVNFDEFYKKGEKTFEVEDEDETERVSAFNKYVKEYKKGEKNVYNHRIHLRAEGGRNRKGEMEMKSVCDETFTHCAWTVNARRSPVVEGEKKEWTMEATLSTLFPQPIESLAQLREQKHRELVATVEASWGSEQKNTVSLRLQGEQSKEQKKWQQLTLRKDNFQTIVLASRLNHFKIAAEYEIVPTTQIQLGRVSALLKSWAPLSSSVEPMSLEKSYNKQGRLTAALSVEPQTWRYVNFTMETPAERVVLQNIRLPFRPTWISIEKSEAVRSIGDLTRRISEQPECRVSSSRIETFDNVIFNAPITTCYSVLAKDCSATPAFAVLMKDAGKKGEEKKLKIVTQEEMVEIEYNNNDFVVRVNKKEIEESRFKHHKLTQKGDFIVFQNEDIKVTFDGEQANIEMSSYYKNQQCGLCGHFDGESEGEFRRADNEETDDIEEFHRSYLAQDEDCTMEEKKIADKSNYRRHEKKSRLEEESSSSEENERIETVFNTNEKKNQKNVEEDEEEREPEEKTRVIEYSNRVCFSKTAVPECPRRFQNGETKTVKVQFSCVDRHSSEARRLLRKARSEVLAISHLPHSFVETLRVPKMCVV